MTSLWRHGRRSRIVLCLPSFVLILASVSCSRPEAETTPQSGGALRVAVLERLDLPSPVRPLGRTTLEFLSHVTPPLGWVNMQGRVELRAARHWLEREYIWDFYLSDLQWEDGQPLRPEDFRATWNANSHPTIRSDWSGRLDFIENVRAYSDTTLRITWKHLPPNRYRSAMFLPLPSHIVGEDPDVTDYRSWPITSDPLSCGPFRMVASTGNMLQLVRNDTWSRTPAHLDSVGVYWMLESDALQAFHQGAVDVIDDISAPAVEHLRDVDDVHTFAAVGRSYIFLAWNLQDGRASEDAVRRAAALAVDVPAMIDAFTLGQGERSRGPLLPIQGFADTSAVHEFDPEQARRLLRRAGWGDSNGNGILDKRGVNLHFEILVAEGKFLHRQVAGAVAASLRDVGFGVDVRALPIVQMLDYLENRTFEAFIAQWFPDLDGNIEGPWSSTLLGHHNYTGYNSAVAESLMTVLRYELSPHRRDQAMSALQRTIYDDQPYLFLFQPPRFTVVSKRLRGADPNVLSTFWNLPEWWIPADLQ